jgi:hypothetical protein
MRQVIIVVAIMVLATRRSGAKSSPQSSSSTNAALASDSGSYFSHGSGFEKPQAVAARTSGKLQVKWREISPSTGALEDLSYRTEVSQPNRVLATPEFKLTTTELGPN